jgi:hypothetical protein
VKILSRLYDVPLKLIELGRIGLWVIHSCPGEFAIRIKDIIEAMPSVVAEGQRCGFARNHSEAFFG